MDIPQMNFLAHVYLSGDEPEILVGNFIGDFVKGKRALETFSENVVKGINLHRAIDAFTDTHPVVTESKSRLREKYRHYAGVIVDVFYDHFLAANWQEFHRVPLTEYSIQTYLKIEQFSAILPDEVKYLLPHMKRGNWLLNYSKVEGIHRALSGMASRTKFISKMDEASRDLVEHYEKFEKEFRLFFPELDAYCRKTLEKPQQY